MVGRLHAWEREAGSGPGGWRYAGHSDNTILNAYYDDLFYFLANNANNPAGPAWNGPQSGAQLAAQLANGVAVTAMQASPAATWTTGLTQLVQLGPGGQTLAISATENEQGLTMGAFTPNQTYPVGTLLLSAVTSLQLSQLVLGVGVGAPARTDPGLFLEWGPYVSYLTVALAAGVPVTQLSVAPLPVAFANGAAMSLNGTNVTVAGGGAAIGATTVQINSFTPIPNFPAGRGALTGTPIFSPAAGTTPQRMTVTAFVANPADPASGTLSFLLPAAANTIPVAFTEAGLQYNSPSAVVAGIGKYASHAPFAYTKQPNVDLRIDYTLNRPPS